LGGFSGGRGGKQNEVSLSPAYTKAGEQRCGRGAREKKRNKKCAKGNFRKKAWAPRLGCRTNDNEETTLKRAGKREGGPGPEVEGGGLSGTRRGGKVGRGIQEKNEPQGSPNGREDERVSRRQTALTTKKGQKKRVFQGRASRLFVPSMPHPPGQKEERKTKRERGEKREKKVCLPVWVGLTKGISPTGPVGIKASKKGDRPGKFFGGREWRSKIPGHSELRPNELHFYKKGPAQIQGTGNESPGRPPRLDVLHGKGGGGGRTRRVSKEAGRALANCPGGGKKRPQGAKKPRTREYPGQEKERAGPPRKPRPKATQTKKKKKAEGQPRDG